MTMLNVLFILVAVVGMFLVFVFLNILINTLDFFYNRRCPHCGKRMHYQYSRHNKEENEIEAYVFHCKHCGAFDSADPLELIRDIKDLKKQRE